MGAATPCASVVMREGVIDTTIEASLAMERLRACSRNNFKRADSAKRCCRWIVTDKRTTAKEVSRERIPRVTSASSNEKPRFRSILSSIVGMKRKLRMELTYQTAD